MVTGTWYENDWLSLSSQVGLIGMYAITKKVFYEWNFITDKKPLQRKHPDAEIMCKCDGTVER